MRQKSIHHAAEKAVKYNAVPSSTHGLATTKHFSAFAFSVAVARKSNDSECLAGHAEGSSRLRRGTYGSQAKSEKRILIYCGAVK